MPRKTNETNEIAIESVKSTDKKSTAVKKSSIKASAAKTSKETSTKTDKKASTKVTTKTTTKATSKSIKSNSKTVNSKKAKSSTSTVKATKTSKKTTSKTNSSAKKSTSTKVANSKKERMSKIVEKSAVIEYYDLPYRYNKTMVKVLAQTPTTLFVYWDISDEDKENYVKQYGDYFFYDTKPVLVVHNSTMNYSYEIDINDYANSWYIHVPDANCDYEIELGRRPINKYSKINDYLEITSSNDIIAPNDHILFEELTNNVYFRNLKTNITSRKDISVSFLTKIDKIYNVQDFYENLYKDEVFSFDKINFRNLPSS